MVEIIQRIQKGFGGSVPGLSREGFGELKRPPGLDGDSTVKALFDAYASAETDSGLYETRAVLEQLNQHRLQLSDANKVVYSASGHTRLSLVQFPEKPRFGEPPIGQNSVR